MNEALVLDVSINDYQENLYQTYSILRNEYPLMRTPGSVWLMSRYDDVLAALKDTTRLKSSGTNNDLVTHLQVTDAPLHKTLRSATASILTASVVDKLNDEIVRIISELFDSIEGRHEVDLLHEVIFEIPRRVLSPLMGLPYERQQELFDIIDPIMGYDPLNPLIASPTVAEEVLAYATEMIEFKRHEPGDDMYTHLIAKEDAGELPANGARTIMTTFLFAAFDTTINLLANGTLALWEFPEQRERLIKQPNLIENAIHEFTRYDAPGQSQPRRVAEPYALHGQEMQVGDEVVLLIGSANRDERHYDNPDELDVARSCRDHLGFGFGAHRCMGQYIARAEAIVYFEQLLQRFPNYEIGQVRHKISHWARALAVLPFYPQGAK